jgi:hypothetical protein
MGMVINGYVRALSKSPPTDADIMGIMEWLNNLIKAVVDEVVPTVDTPPSDPTDPDVDACVPGTEGACVK